MSFADYTKLAQSYKTLANIVQLNEPSGEGTLSGNIELLKTGQMKSRKKLDINRVA
jgi:hypothetical protein